MDTLYEFLLLTKGQEYLIAIALVLIFPLFWRWLNGSPKRRTARE
jgi:hypothetical protein